ncbi:MAG TPA: hypothetical protein RMH99_20255 [Sandaracinaceae bacterium LLY-WYZ-13_1]|nr:hypothetical protein [Sandaracinaceae bacterium LLY-WYZ-13_1]
MRKTFALLAAALALGCEGGDPSLALAVRTDLVPGVELATIEVTLSPADDPDDVVYFSETEATVEGAWVDGQIVASPTLPRGTYTGRVRVFDWQGRRVLERTLRARLDWSQVLTLLLTRECRGVECPESAACHGGRCVDPACAEEDLDACGEPACEVSADCPRLAECAERRCLAGICLYVERSDACDSGLYCEPESGCREDPRDDDPCGCDDANPCTEDRCVADDRCEHVPFLAGVDCGTECSLGTCDGSGVCIEEPREDRCLVDGVCRTPGETHPSVTCLVCDPERAADSWSAAASTSCGAGGTCDATGACRRAAEALLRSAEHDDWGKQADGSGDTLVFFANYDSRGDHYENPIVMRRDPSGTWESEGELPAGARRVAMDGEDFLTVRPPRLGGEPATVTLVRRIGPGTFTEALVADLHTDDEEQIDVANGRAVVAETGEAVHLFERDGGTWRATATLEAPTDGDANAWGEGVRLHGDELFVGAPRTDRGDDSTVGRVFVYRRVDADRWELAQELAPPADAGRCRHFGSQIRVDGPLAAFATGCLTSSDRQGAVVIFRRESAGWVLETTIRGGRSLRPAFASAIDLVGRRLLVGAPLEEVEGVSDAGAVYLYERDAPGVWTLVTLLTLEPLTTAGLGRDAVLLLGEQAIAGVPSLAEGDGWLRGGWAVFDVSP